MLDTKTKPQSGAARRADAASQAPRESESRPRGRSLQRDVILGGAMGFALTLAFGGPILSGLGVFWHDVVVPAFYTLAQAGLAYCG